MRRPARIENAHPQQISKNRNEVSLRIHGNPPTSQSLRGHIRSMTLSPRDQALGGIYQSPYPALMTNWK
jgi:hypothetical protein